MLQSQRNSTRLSAKFLHDRGQECTLSAYSEAELAKLMKADAQQSSREADSHNKLSEDTKKILSLMSDDRHRTTADIATRLNMKTLVVAGSVRALCIKGLLSKDWIDGTAIYSLSNGSNREVESKTQITILKAMEQGVFYKSAELADITGVSRKSASNAMARACDNGKVEKRLLASNPKHYEWRKL